MANKTKNRYTNDELIAAINAAASEALEPFPSNDDLDDPVNLPMMRRTSYAMSADILCCALFGIAKGSARAIVDGKPRHDRAYVEITFQTTNGASIEFRGK